MTLEQLVSANLQGAQLRQSKLISEDGGTLMQEYVVIWQRGEEWGTHRAVMSYELGEFSVMWGHYFRGPNACPDAYRDYVERISDENV